MARSVPYFQQTQHTLDLLSLLTRETLTGTRVIRAFRREEHGKKRFDASAQDQARIAIAVGKLSAVLNPATFLVMNLGTVAILWSGGIEVNAGLVTQGEIVAFMNYMLQTLRPCVCGQSCSGVHARLCLRYTYPRDP
jgi:ATP-binding cassette subfamily B protein